jgi:conjugative relaxase-like TrwC/TraI family protein
VTATLHKLTAGDGYTYLTRQVAAADSTERGRDSLADYYSAKGESPGRWLGSGLAALSDTGGRDVPTETVAAVWTVEESSPVSEDQMRALFGEGLHPNAVDITDYHLGRGAGERAAISAARLGTPFAIRSGETKFQQALAVAYREHNTETGQHWAAAIEPDVRATIRTRIARERFADEHGRPPADDRELSGYIARNTRAATTAVAGYDVTFSPVKSVSTLWAVAPLEVATTIEAAHDAAVADALAFLEERAAFTRTGHDGIAQVDTTGLIAAAFTHRDSRAGDPDLHTHVAISNKVAHVDAGGAQRWLALDGQPLHRVMVAASELYNTRLEAHLGQRLGLQFHEATPPGRGKRPIREVVGVSADLMGRWSSRRAAIEARTAELSKRFQADHGREPTNVEAIALAQQATLETREAKHEPRSVAEQRQTWRAEAIEILGSTHHLTQMLGATLAATPTRPAPQIDPQWIADRARDVLGTVALSRSVWQRHHVLAEAQRIVRKHGVAADDTLAGRITAAALHEAMSTPIARIGDAEMGEPAALRRRDGTSVYSRDGVALYTSHEIVAAERRLLDAAHRRDGRTVTTRDIELALSDATARGKTLNPGQVALVREMAAGGRRVALALAPAGSGKTTAMAALSHAWRSSGGNVVGLAPTAAAAINLGTDLGAPADTLDKYIQLTDNWAHSPEPEWFTGVDASTLLIVDEAGLAGTLQLDTVIGHALARGASVRLVGDDGQIASIAAGGILRDIATDTEALTLSQLVRFTTPDQGAASLALRAGDPAGIGYYIDHHRVHVGAEDTAADMAFQAWHTDTTNGNHSILLAPTNDLVDSLNARAQAARAADTLAADPTWTPGATTVLADGLPGYAGEIIRTRENARKLQLTGTDYVRNGYTYTITEVLDDGGVRARHNGTGRHITLPAGYVAEHVTLGYANTIDGAQGLTAGHSCHVVGAEHLSRQQLYVALSRARVENHLYLSTAEADPHRVLAPKATHPDTAVDVLTKILARDGAQVSATTADRQAADPVLRLGAAAGMYADALASLAEHRLGPDRLDALAVLAEGTHPGLAEASSWPVLRQHLALLACAGADPGEALTEAVARGGLDDAADPAAVLDWRIDPTGGHSAGVGPLRWLPAIPQILADDPQVGGYLTTRAHLVTELAEHIRTQAQSWTPATAPAWAAPLIHADAHGLAAEIAVFRAAHNVPAEDSRLLGAPLFAARPRAIAQLLLDAAIDTIGTHRPAMAQFAQLVDGIDPAIRTDSYWPALADHLATIAPVRPDLGALVREAADERPLPDELPAAALWWRLAGRLHHTTTLHAPHTRITPDWLPDLAAVFGTATAELITADPAWPGLVATIAAADPQRWTPADLLALAGEHLAEADPTHTEIAPQHYARLITASIDMITTADPHHAPLPEHPPLTPEEHEALAHLDPEQDHPDLHGDLDAVWTAPSPTELEPPIDGDYYPDPQADDLGHLAFEDLSATRTPPPPLPAALLDVAAVRTDYQQALDTYTTLADAVAAGTGPNTIAAADRIRDLRAAAEADRPYLSAVQDVMAAWAEAEAANDAAQAQVDWAQTQLDRLLVDPGADPLDVAAARAEITVRRMMLPDLSPAERFYPALTDATRARTQAAGGTIITDADVHTVRHDAEAQDLAALRAARTRMQDLRRDLDRAEYITAAAFTATNTSALDHILSAQHRTELDTELRALAAAGVTNTRNPLVLSSTRPDDPVQAVVATAAAQPFTVSVITTPPGPALDAAVAELEQAATAAGWQTHRYSSTDPAQSSVAELHQQITDTQWRPQTGDIIVIDSATDADPTMLADLAEHAAAGQARLILLDTTTPTWPPQPAHQLLQLLHTDLPWALTVTDPNSRIDRTRPPVTPGAPDLQPALTQIGRLDPTQLTDQLRAALDKREQLREQHRVSNDVHQVGGRFHGLDRGLEHDLAPRPDGLDL